MRVTGNGAHHGAFRESLTHGPDTRESLYPELAARCTECARERLRQTRRAAAAEAGRVDASFEDRRVDLVEEGYDLALRVTRDGALPPGLIARPLRTVSFFIAASREYLKRNGAPESPEDLARHDFVAVGNLDSLQLTGPKGKIEVPLRVVLRYRSMSGVANAVAAGIGLAPLPDLFFEDPMFKDVLKPVLTDFPLQEPTLHVVYVSRKHLPLKIRAFIDFVQEMASRIQPPRLAAAG
jgi:DNA-binding transcriptional LysR family regulator